MTSDESTTKDEWESRQLCSDGNCIGVIGPDGRCKECGKPAEGGPIPAAKDGGDPAPEDPPVEAEAETDEPPPEAEALESDDGDWADRRLCPDGNCIGVIGPDGKCKECGRPAE